jgi:hypothetical protein
MPPGNGMCIYSAAVRLYDLFASLLELTIALGPGLGRPTNMACTMYRHIIIIAYLIDSDAQCISPFDVRKCQQLLGVYCA